MVVVIGGMKNVVNPVAAVEMIDPHSEIIETVINLSGPRAEVSVVQISRKELLVTGGRNSSFAGGSLGVIEKLKVQ